MGEGMNKNIEVINENLWAVNQEYVKAGYIRDIVTLSGQTPEKNPISLHDYGILILNKNDPAYEITRKTLIRIMGHTDNQLKFAHEKMISLKKTDAYEKMYLNVLGWEIERRCVRADYLKSLSKPTLKDIIKKNFREKVKIWQLFKQG